jgi:hypothetical protein
MRGTAKDEQSAGAELPASMGMLKSATVNRSAAFVTDGQFHVLCMVIPHFPSSAIELRQGILLKK